MFWVQGYRGFGFRRVFPKHQHTQGFYIQVICLCPRVEIPKPFVVRFYVSLMFRLDSLCSRNLPPLATARPPIHSAISRGLHYALLQPYTSNPVTPRSECNRTEITSQAPSAVNTATHPQAFLHTQELYLGLEFPTV